jgi:hypothetical protein
MELIEPDEMTDFAAVLARYHLDTDDFGLSEIDTTDPQTDEIFALTGTLTVTQKSTGRQKQYPIGDGSTWVAEFQRDVIEGFFH